MTTFHITTEQVEQGLFQENSITNSCDLGSIFLSELREIVNAESSIYQKITGFAVKISKLNLLGIELETLLGLTNSLIIIDAESDRLDLYLERKINDNLISCNQLHRCPIRDFDQ